LNIIKHQVTSPKKAALRRSSRGSRDAMRGNGHLSEAVLDQQTSRGREGCLFWHRFSRMSMDWFKGKFTENSGNHCFSHQLIM